LAHLTVEQFADVGELFRLAPRHDLLLYVHGYNQTFETAVLDVVRLSDGISRIFTGRTAWAKAHTRWLCEQTFDHPAQHVVLAEYGRAIEDAESRLERLTGP
jgi:hypothetical protein